jgi:tetratricopeptide (TPR) repeat protein
LIVKRILVWGLLLVLLNACTSQRPAPVEEREVTRRVRAPAEEESAGVQVYPLQNPAVVELTQQASEAEDTGDYEGASVLLERALRIRPRDPQILQHMAEVKLQMEDYEQALSFAVRSHDIGPRVGEICARNWRTIAVARGHLGDAGGAREAERRVGQCMNTKTPSL